MGALADAGHWRAKMRILSPLIVVAAIAATGANAADIPVNATPVGKQSLVLNRLLHGRAHITGCMRCNEGYSCCGSCNPRCISGGCSPPFCFGPTMR
jgi:hypothetical protein